MSRAAPTFAGGFSAAFRLEFTRLVRSSRLRIALVAVALVLVSVLVVRYAGDGATPDETLKKGVELGFFRILVFLMPLVFAVGIVSEEVESRTFSFLAIRPTSRTALFLGKALAAFALGSATLVSGMLVAHLATLAASPGLLASTLPWTLKALLALEALLLAYTLLGAFASALVVEAPAVITTLYLVILEWFGGLAPSLFRLVSLHFHATSLVGFERGGLMPDSVPAVSPLVSAAVLAAVCLVLAGGGIMTFRSSEYRPR